MSQNKISFCGGCGRFRGRSHDADDCLTEQFNKTMQSVTKLETGPGGRPQQMTQQELFDNGWETDDECFNGVHQIYNKSIGDTMFLYLRKPRSGEEVFGETGPTAEATKESEDPPGAEAAHSSSREGTTETTGHAAEDETTTGHATDDETATGHAADGGATPGNAKKPVRVCLCVEEDR